MDSSLPWNKNIYLGPPPLVEDHPEFEDANVIYKHYGTLQRILFATNHSVTEDRTMSPRKVLPDTGVSVVIMSAPEDSMSILLEGCRRCPGDMLLVLSQSWITFSKTDKKSEWKSMFVHKAVTFESSCKSYLDVFNPPRRVSYFFNNYQNLYGKSFSEDLENNLDCPMSGSPILNKVINDKLWARDLMTKAGLVFPKTLAFTFGTPEQHKFDSVLGLTFVRLDLDVNVEKTVSDAISTFLDSIDDKEKMFMVRRTGSQRKLQNETRPSYHIRNDANGIKQAVLDVLHTLQPEEGVLLEVTQDTGEPYPCSTNQNDLKFSIWANVCRSTVKNSKVSSIICETGQGTETTSTRTPQSLKSTLKERELGKEEERITNLITDMSKKLFQTLISEEIALVKSKTGGTIFQTDVIGIEYIMAKENGIFTPFPVNIKGNDSLSFCHFFELMNPSFAGKTVAPLVRTMVERSQEYMMQNKILLVIGKGRVNKEYLWKLTEDKKIKVVLVDNIPKEKAPKVYHFIQYDFMDRQNNDSHAAEIIRRLKREGITVDGCCAYLEDNTLLASIICEILGLNGSGVKGTQASKVKSATQKTLFLQKQHAANYPRFSSYASKSIRIRSVDDISSAVDQVSLPCVLKFEYGCCQVGVQRCNSKEQCIEAFGSFKSFLENARENDYPTIGLTYENEMMLMPYLDGTEHDIDVVMYKQQLVMAIVRDNGLTRPDSFLETSNCWPSFLSLEKQRQLIAAAYLCCIGVGLESGVFNVEMKMTSTGPKLIELNARMAGYIIRSWLSDYCGIELALYVSMIACGMRPIPPPSIDPEFQLMGIMCFPSLHAELLNEQNKRTLKRYADNGDINCVIIRPSQHFDPSKGIEFPLCNISVTGSSLEEAKDKLLSVCKTLKITKEEYDVEHFLSIFKI
ncbi:carnosine synthase 1-like [Saccostrea cucullata]|uniref:carnosine synthase 1-like n=1 Tax=Saccostrea cuccullata TaxID=36930 RepID=UPI002ED083FE